MATLVRQTYRNRTRAAALRAIGAVADDVPTWREKVKVEVDRLDGIALGAQRDGYLDLVLRIERTVTDFEFASERTFRVGAPVVRLAVADLLSMLDRADRRDGAV
jgi:hypothetical protein